jgi:Tfp pilus assembly protein PilF
VIGIVQVGRQSHADRYTYLPMIGFTMAIAWTIHSTMRGRNDRHFDVEDSAPAEPSQELRNLAAGMAAASATSTTGISFVVFTALIFAAHRQISTWRDSRSLWEHALLVQRDNSIARNNLGEALAAAGDYDGSMAQYRRGIEVDDTTAINRRNLAVQCIARGDDKSAKPLLRRALQLDPTDIETFSTLAGIYVRENRLDDALLLYRQAVQRDPKYADGFYNIGVTLAQQGKYELAIEALRRATELRPEDDAAAKALRDATNAARRN